MNKKLTKLYIKIVLVNICDVIVILATVFFLGKLPQIASQVSKLHGQALAGEQSSEGAVIKADLDREKEKISTLDALFLDDVGLVRFNEQISRLKTSEVISDATFVSTTPILDFTGSRGLPLLFKVKGDKESINNAIKQITDLNALIRPVSVKLTKPDASYALEYGVFIYIK